MSVTILHVVSSPPAMYTGLPAVEENLAQVLARENPLSQHLKEAANMASAAQVEAHIELRHGMVSEEILRSCDVKNHDLIVIGAPARRALLGKAFLGSIAPHLLASADCSTLIIRDEPYTPAS
jgi:nucleotide-binding universal stress UspA family protein